MAQPAGGMFLPPHFTHATSGTAFVLTLSEVGAASAPAGLFWMNMNDEMGTVPLNPPHPPVNPPTTSASANQDNRFAAFSLCRINFRRPRSWARMCMLSRLGGAMQTLTSSVSSVRQIPAPSADGQTRCLRSLKAKSESIVKAASLGRP